MTSLKKDVEEVRHFIIAVDFSKNSQEAFAWALKNLIRAGDVIHLVNARPGSHAVIRSTGGGSFDDDGYNLGIEQIFETLSLSARKALSVDVEYHIRSGDPRDVLLAEAKSKNASAIVMGCRSLSTTQRLFLGSTSAHCSRNADCPVIIVRGKED